LLLAVTHTCDTHSLFVFYQMSFERTVRHVNEVKEECATHSYVISDAVVAETSSSTEPTSVAESSVSATHDAEVENPIAQSAAEIAEIKKQEELAKKSKAEMVKLMTNQRKLQRAKEKRESRIKDQLDSISVSDAEQRFARVQLNKTTNVSVQLSFVVTVSQGWLSFLC